MLLTFFDISARTHYLNARQTLQKLLEWSVVPVINENDTTTTDEISFGNNDFLAAQVAILLGAERLLLLTDAGGVYTADPRFDPAAELVRDVTNFESLSELSIGHQTSPLGSGGMRSKVVAAEMATAAGIPTVIASGLEPGTILTAAAGQPVGTLFPARSEPLLELQAVAALRQTVPRSRRSRCRRRPGPARRGHQPAARRGGGGTGRL